jgi:hypothetical protein
MKLIDTMSLKEGRKVWIVASVTVAAPYEAFVVYEIWETEKVNVERSVVYVVALRYVYAGYFVLSLCV